MSITAKSIISGVIITDTPTSYYTVPANTKCLVKKLSFTNSSLSAATISVYLVTVDTFSAENNVIAKWQSIAAGETWECAAAVGQVLEQGTSIVLDASPSATINCISSGAEIV